MIIHRAISRGIAAALVLLAGAGCRKPEKDRLALVGGTVIDVNDGSVLPNAVVVIYKTRIETVAPAAGFKIPKTAQVIDVSGKFLMPGLIDAHAHVQRWALARYLAFGVTTVRDVHGQEDSIGALRDEVNLGAIPGPRMFIAGAMIDGAPPTYSDAGVATTPDEGRRLVDQRALTRSDLVKVYTRITPGLLRPIVLEAGTLSLPVAAHLGLTDAITAANAGVRSIEHLSGIPEAASASPAPFYAAHARSFFDGWNYFEKSWATLDSADLSRVAQALALTKVYLVPTLVLHETFSRLDDPAIMSSSLLDVVPDSEKTKWNVPDLILRAGWTQPDFAAFRNSRANQDLFVREFKAAGGVLVTGTDASNQMLVPGLSEHRELELLVAAGLTTRDALQSATRSAAALLAADSIGRIAPGKVADILILTADPLANIKNTRSIEKVILRGLVYPVDSIRAAW
ncbi:MAG: amidohydrolase family protein [Gemmatimonadota bacterium]